MRILLIQATKNIKNKSAIVHRLAKIAERVGHTLHLPEVIGHGEVTFEEVAEFGVEEEGASLPIADELFFDAEPDAASSGRGDNLRELSGDGVLEPPKNCALHACPRWDHGEGLVGEHVIREGIFAHDEEKEVAPLGVVGGAEIEDDQDERPDVGKANCLGVEVGDGSSLVSMSFHF